MKLLFLSYVEEDQSIALELANALAVNGYTAWCYEIDNLPGQSYLLSTQQAINQCQAFLLLVSPHSIGSHQVDVEIERAHEEAKPVVPVLWGIKDKDYKVKKPLWAQIIGTRSSISITQESVLSVANRVAEGLNQMGIIKQPTIKNPTPLAIDESKEMSHDPECKITLQVPDAKSNSFNKVELFYSKEALMSHEEYQTICDIEKIVGRIMPIAADHHVSYDDYALQIYNGHISQLQLCKIGLTHLPESIRNLRWLTWLCLDDNELVSLPDCLNLLVSLETLSLKNNKLEALPKTLQVLTRPIKIDFGEVELFYSKEALMSPEEYQTICDIEKIVGRIMPIAVKYHVSYDDYALQIYNGHVSQLQLCKIGLAHLPESIRNLRWLTWLCLDDNELISLPDCFNMLESLKTLSLKNNKLEALPKTLQVLTRPIKIDL